LIGLPNTTRSWSISTTKNKKKKEKESTEKGVDGQNENTIFFLSFFFQFRLCPNLGY